MTRNNFNNIPNFGRPLKIMSCRINFVSASKVAMRVLPVMLLGVVIGFAPSSNLYAQVPAPEERHLVNAGDTAAIEDVMKRFQAALIQKDTKLLSSLMLNSHIPFFSPVSAERIRKAQETIDVNYDGISGDGYPRFAEFIKKSQKPVQEKFYNVKIVQDANFAVVLFDFEFV